eukprot:scaffold6697_cov262-Amphora_coffeaeformis.AAC.2
MMMMMMMMMATTGDEPQDKKTKKKGERRTENGEQLTSDIIGRPRDGLAALCYRHQTFKMDSTSSLRVFLLQILLWTALNNIPTFCFHCQAFSPGDSSASFSLSNYQKARAWETSQSLDASRLHFQILIVDDDNAKGRIAAGLLAKIAEYNDAMCVLFPTSATLEHARTAPRDAAASADTLHACAALGLCRTTCEEIGTAFTLPNLDEYDLIIAMHDDIRSIILQSVTRQQLQQQQQQQQQDGDEDDTEAVINYYASKCKSLAQFLGLDFSTSLPHLQQQQQQAYAVKDDRSNDVTQMANILLQMLDTEQLELVNPFVDILLSPNQDIDKDQMFREAILPSWPEQPHQQPRLLPPRLVLNDQGAAVVPPLSTSSWAAAQAAIILATAGVVRFCLDALDLQLRSSLDTLLERNLYDASHLQLPWETIDEQLGKCNASVCGYFSPQQRHAAYQRHVVALKARILSEEESSSSSSSSSSDS